MNREREKILVIGINDGPWVRVRNLCRIVIRGATKKDMFELNFKDQVTNYPPEPVMFTGSGEWNVMFPGGRVRVKRVKGNSITTVLAYQEVRT